MTREQIYKAEHDLLTETLSLIWELEKTEEKTSVGYYACGIHDMASELLRMLDKVKEVKK